MRKISGSDIIEACNQLQPGQQSCKKGILMKTVKEYALSKDVTHQSVYKLLKKHPEIMEHTLKQGNVLYLLPEAQNELDKYRKQSIVMIEKQIVADEIQELKNQIALLLVKNADQANELASVYKKISEQSQLIVSAEANVKLLEYKDQELNQIKEQLDQAERGRLEAESRTTVLEQQLNAFNEAQSLKEAEKAELELKLKEAEEALEKQKDDWKKKSLFQRLFKK